MATIDNIISLHQPKPLTPAQRAKAYRDRKRAARNNTAPAGFPSAVAKAPPAPKAPHVTPVAPVTGVAAVRPQPSRPVTPSRERQLAPVLLNIAAFGLSAVGITMNGWFARSLGSSDIAGWLFLAIGVAADLAALAIPTCAASLWQTRQRGAAATAWAVWLATFLFAISAGIGFASVNISDVTASRASRITPAVTSAQAALADAMASRDRECAGGVGKNCRSREEAVAERRRSLDAAMSVVEQSADPQVEAASRIVAWLSLGSLRPGSSDIAMLRLILLSLLPQIGGILLMIGRRAD